MTTHTVKGGMAGFGIALFVALLYCIATGHVTEAALGVTLGAIAAVPVALLLVALCGSVRS